MATSPEKQLEVVISIDTTSSMPSWLSTLQANFKTMTQRLQRDLPGIRIGVIAHGDYCDVDKYVTMFTDFTLDVPSLCDFVSKIQNTYGGDAPECYELVLRKVAIDFSWALGSRRVLTMLGDNVPHEPHEECNKDKIDWKEETENLKNLGVKIYGVQCKAGAGADNFFETISKVTNGKRLKLQNEKSLCDTLAAVCYKESGDAMTLASFQEEITNRSSGPGGDLEGVFAVLKENDNFRDEKETSDVNGNGAPSFKIISSQKSPSDTNDTVAVSKVNISLKPKLHKDDTLVLKILGTSELKNDYKDIKHILTDQTSLAEEDIATLYRFKAPGRWYMRLTSEAKTSRYDGLHRVILSGPDYQLLVEHLDKESVTLELHWVPPTFTDKEVASILKEIINDSKIMVHSHGSSEDQRLMFVDKDKVGPLPAQINISCEDEEDFHTIEIRRPAKNVMSA